MPNRSKGARLWLRPAAGSRPAVYIIRDGARWISTGFGPENLREAQQKLANFIAENRVIPRIGARHPSQIEIADVLAIYGQDHGASVARPNELEQRARALLAFFGDKKLSAVNGKLCRDYVAQRGSISMARRELEDLRAAIKHHRMEGLCSEVVEITLPEKSQPRERWLTRDEAARLLWAAWRGGTDNRQHVQDKRRHVARFILVALYTGSRAGAVCGAAMRQVAGRGHVDLKAGIFYRRAAGKKETKKRQPPVRLPERLLAHLRRWDSLEISTKAVVEWKGQPVTRMAKGFRHAARDAGLAGVHPHVLRHTAVTWAMQNGADLWEAAGFFGMTVEVLQGTYGHHRPDAGKGVNEAIGSKPDRDE